MLAEIDTAANARQYRIAISVFFFISGLGYSTWASRIPSIQQQLHLNEAQLGAVLLALPIGLMLTMPVTGKLLGAFSSRKIMLYGALVFNVILSLPGFATSVWQLALVLFCFGSARNLLNLSMNAQAVHIQHMHHQSIITTFHGIWSIAGFTGAAIGYLMVTMNVAPSYHLLIISILLLGFTLVYYPKTYADQPIVSDIKKPVFSLPDKSLLKYSLICFACMATENTMYDWSGIYFQKVVHASKPTATAAFVIYMIAMTTGRFAGDKLVATIGIKKILHYSGWLILTGLSLAIIFPYPLPAGIGFVFAGFGVSCVVPLVFSLAGKSKNTNGGQTLAAISTIGYLGFLVVPPLVGFVAQATSLRYSFAIMAICGVLIIGMVRGIKTTTP
ncbi:MFS transporter [Chitinophaga nivalis]|uniref:MFS transporter n=1 Tax=Chitinophaga nivalis TaxID=2991709 RepID=A0ABT3IGN2_9BACT|nr:MFS transporter [Chitinophaga nivalis]MCW3467242.1 MFS transporter [Chitinophaga nivalis]MCW3483066.1 MFS transporter [Chitinophaga nivalis]